MLLESVQRFAADALAPKAGAFEDALGPDVQTRQAWWELGLHLMAVPEALGGLGEGAKPVTSCLCLEALGHGDMGAALALWAPVAALNLVCDQAPPQQRDALVPRLLEAGPGGTALAVLEPAPRFHPRTAATRLRADGDGHLLDGHKIAVAGGAEASLLLVLVRDEQERPVAALLAADGLDCEPAPMMGLRAAGLASVRLEGARAAADSVFPLDAQRFWALSRLASAALALGGCQAALDYVIPYVKEREAFGEPIAQRQSIAFAVASAGTELEAARLLTWKGAARAERGEDFARQALLAHSFAARHGMQIGTDAVQLLGGHGFVKEHPVERWYRDLRALGSLDGFAGA